MFFDFLRIAFAFFSEKMNLFITLLTTDITTFQHGIVWSGVKILYNAFLSVGITMAAILMMVNLIDSSYRLIELKKPTVIIKYFCEVTLLFILLQKTIDVLLWIYNFGAGLTRTALTAAGILTESGDQFFNISLSDEAEELYDSMGWISLDKTPLRIICIVAGIWVIIATITIMLVVYGRLFNIFILVAVSPITVACSLSSQTRRIFYSYLKTFTSVALEALVIVVALYIFKIFSASIMSEQMAGNAVIHIIGNIYVNVNPGGDSGVILDSSNVSGYLMNYLIELSFLFAVLIAAIKGSEQLVNRIFGI